MNKTAIFWPMIAHVALVYAVYVVLGVRRIGAVRTGGASANQFKTRRPNPSEALRPPTTSSTSSNCRCCSTLAAWRCS